MCKPCGNHKTKPILDTQKIKESKCTTTENHEFSKKGCKRKAKEQYLLYSGQKTVNEIVLVSPYLSITTLKVNAFYSPIKRHRECIKKKGESRQKIQL